MYKDKYLLKIDTTNWDNVDPNLKLIDYNIAKNKSNLFFKDYYDFEICAIINGYIENNYINEVLTAFYHDIIDETNFFHYIFKSENRSLYFQKFIKNLFTTSKGYYDKKIADGMHEMDAILRVDGKEFTFVFFLPDTIITKAKYDEFMHLGPDGLVGNMRTDEIFEYFLPYLYMKLAHENCLDKKDLKNPMKYLIGLH